MTERPEERDSLERVEPYRVGYVVDLRARITALEAEVKELREEYAAYRKASSETLRAAHARIRQMEEALRYIARPTMGLPPGREPVEFVDAVPEHIVRLVLKTCIRIATAASDTG